MRVKVCGLTHLSDARMSIHHGAWAVGFNFHPASPRYLSKSAAQAIIAQLPPSVLKVGIFVKETVEVITQQMEELELDLVQLYSPVNATKKFKARVILALQVASEAELPSARVLSEYAYLLLDAPLRADGLMGGTGRVANWALAATLARDYRLLLAGGLTAENVKKALDQVKPYAVDVASGVEQSPGLKDELRMKHFFEECRDEQ
jgi:phosphoribosylanthranilate isomerase